VCYIKLSNAPFILLNSDGTYESTKTIFTKEGRDAKYVLINISTANSGPLFTMAKHKTITRFRDTEVSINIFAVEYDTDCPTDWSTGIMLNTKADTINKFYSINYFLQSLVSMDDFAAIFNYQYIDIISIVAEMRGHTVIYDQYDNIDDFREQLKKAGIRCCLYDICLKNYDNILNYIVFKDGKYEITARAPKKFDHIMLLNPYLECALLFSYKKYYNILTCGSEISFDYICRDEDISDFEDYGSGSVSYGRSQIGSSNDLELASILMLLPLYSQLQELIYGNNLGILIKLKGLNTIIRSKDIFNGASVYKAVDQLYKRYKDKKDVKL
jgi:hypothetical protein